jgi:hypothetical protein
MPFVLPKPEDHVGESYENAKGNTECVEFAKAVIHGLPTPAKDRWKSGLPLVGNESSLIIGTLIATFDANGNYPSQSTGNHAAFFVRKDHDMLVVVDQYKGSGGVKVSRYRYLDDKSRSALVASAKYSMTKDPATYAVVESRAAGE